MKKGIKILEVRRSAKIETLSKLFYLCIYLKALNKRILEWAHFLNLAKRFLRYSNFSAPKKRGFFRQDLDFRQDLAQFTCT